MRDMAGFPAEHIARAVYLLLLVSVAVVVGCEYMCFQNGWRGSHSDTRRAWQHAEGIEVY